MNGALLKPCCRRTKDEVGGALDIAVVKEQARSLHTRINGVLMTQETAVDEFQAVALCMQGHSLSQTGGIILYRQVLESDVVGIHPDGIGAEGSHPQACRRIEDVGMVVVGVPTVG